MIDRKTFLYKDKTLIMNGHLFRDEDYFLQPHFTMLDETRRESIRYGKDARLFTRSFPLTRIDSGTLSLGGKHEWFMYRSTGYFPKPGDIVAIDIKMWFWEPTLFELYEPEQQRKILTWFLVAKRLNLDREITYFIQALTWH